MITSCPHSLYFFRGDVENFDSFDKAVNTFKDWHIVPLGRPVVVPPQQKLQLVDIPGANGVLDLSNSLTKYPVFDNRQGTMKFAVLNNVPRTDWLTTYTKILKFLQGNNVKMIMEDDPKYYYEGRFYVDEWDSRNDGTWSEVTLGYDLQPYRRSIYSSIDPWLWDPFNFETDVITSTSFYKIPINSPSGWDVHDVTGLIDMMPVIPKFDVTVTSGSNIKVQLYNSDLGINWKEYTLTAGNDRYFYNFILCENTPESVVKMRFQGVGTVTVKFRSGRL